MDIDTMQRQLRDLLAFKAMAEPMLFQMQASIAQLECSSRPAETETKAHDSTISSEPEFKPATDDIHEINAALAERDSGAIEADETEQHDG
jgi:hypothetical protein